MGLNVGAVNQTGAVGRTLDEAERDSLAVRSIALNIGKIYYVDAVNGNDGNDGLSLDKAFSTLAVALAVMVINDTLFVARGGYTGDFSTPLNGVAPFTNIIGMNATDKGFGPFMASSTSTVATIDVQARGMRISGIEFDCPALGPAVLGSNNGGTIRGDFLEIDHCLFTGGKFGLDNGGGITYCHAHHNIFDLMSVAAGSAITATSTAQKLPGRWRVEENEFLENVNHMDMNVTVGSHGFNSSIIGPNNVFQHKGQARDVTVALDIQGGAGNLVVGNFIGGAKSLSTGGTTYEIGNDDRAAGNVFTDGVQTADFAST